MRIVVALGGNALLERGEKPEAAPQRERARLAAEALAPLAEKHELIITHGNGPQVGVLALESATDPNLEHPYPFDVLGAQTQGMIGYWLLQSLQNALPGRQVASLVNQTLVRANDPAFGNPTKFVGTTYTEEEAKAKAKAEQFGWVVKPDGKAWRRVVASPTPQRMVETRIARLLLSSGAVVVCSGGGGIPVIRDEQGKLKGVEAVIDKDLAAGRLAEALEADALLILPDTPFVMRDYGKPTQAPILRATPGELLELDFPAGSMGPKVEAVCRFVEMTGDLAGIGTLADAEAMIEGTAGTIITPGGNYGGPGDLRPRHELALEI